MNVFLLLAMGGSIIVIVVTIHRLRAGRSGTQYTVSAKAYSTRTPVMIDVPRPPFITWLYVHDGPTMQGETIPLQSLRITIGTEANSDILLQGDNIPDLACTIGFTPDESYAVLTAESDAKATLNGREVLQQRLSPRDVISIGQYSLIYFDSIWRV